MFEKKKVFSYLDICKKMRKNQSNFSKNNYLIKLKLSIKEDFLNSSYYSPKKSKRFKQSYFWSKLLKSIN